MREHCGFDRFVDDGILIDGQAAHQFARDLE